METAQLPELLTDKEAAAYLRLKPKNGHITVRRWVREGRLRSGHAGDLLRFRKEDLDDFVFAKK